MHTPWGIADHVEVLLEGVTRVSTPSHGGIRCAQGANAQVPLALRNDDGWYEEDVEANFVIVSFPDHFGTERVDRAAAAIRDWCPDRYEAWSGLPATPENSYKAAEAHFAAAHAADFVAVAARVRDGPAVTRSFRRAGTAPMGAVSAGRRTV